MKKIHEVFSLVNKDSWFDYWHIKSYDDKLSTLVAFVASTLGYQVLQRSYQEVVSEGSTFFEEDLFSEMKILVVDALPAKLNIEIIAKLESLSSFYKVVTISASNLPKTHKAWQESQFFQLDKNLWDRLQVVLSEKLITQSPFSDSIGSMDKAVEVLQYQVLGIALDALPGIDNQSSNWTLLEQLMKLGSGQDMTNKQLFQAAHSMEAIYQWHFAPAVKKKNFYIPIAVKKKIQRIGPQKIELNQKWFYQFIESLAVFEYESARFYLTLWSKGLL